MVPVKAMINRILQASPNLSQHGIGSILQVSQPTINRWFNGESSPTAEHLAALTELYEQANLLLADAPLLHTRFRYVCSFAPRYTRKLVDDAQRVLRDAIHEFSERKPDGPACSAQSDPTRCLDIELHIRAAALSSNIRAHTFQGTLSRRQVFLVLVNRDLSETEQLHVAWDEAFAHVMGRLIGDSATVKHPKPIIR
jgi:transcriptional regulator with XRE-family HTH domain